MTDELEKALALVFRKFRSPVVPEGDLVKLMSLQLNWTKPSEAPYLLARGVQHELLEHSEAGYRPRFDPNGVDVPFGFKPPRDLFSETALSEPDPEAAEVPVEPEEAPRTAETLASSEPALEDGPTDRPVLESILDAIASHTGEGRREAAAAVNAKQEALDDALSLDACALLVAAELGIDVEDYARQVLDSLKVG